MMRRLGLVLGIAAFLIVISSGIIFSQEGTVEKKEAVAPEEQVLGPAEPEIQWLWGEVASVDVLKKEILVKYLDYDTDEEKEMAINVDDKATYENVKIIDEIKPQDTVSIDYIVKDGKNIAKNISVEKAGETAEPTDVEKPETAPDVTE